MRRAAVLPLLVAAWLGLTAATPLPLTPPPPDLTGLVPFVSAPLDKPLLALPVIPLPPAPIEVPAVPPAHVVRPAADKPTATMPPPRTLPCVGAWTGAAGEALECGRARLQRGDLRDAAQALEQAMRNARDRELGTEARYWLAETLYRMGRFGEADGHFRQVAQQNSAALSPFGLHGSGWCALILGDATRARDTFTQLLGGPHPMAIDAWGRHGQALALYGLGRHADAQRVWADLLSRRAPPAIERDVVFWNGDALGRTGEAEKGADELKRFTQGGPHPLLAPGLVRLGWWSLVAKRPAESAAAIRAYPGPPMPQPKPESKPDPSKPAPPTLDKSQEAADADWIDATLALALLASGDLDGARSAAQPLETRRSPLALPVQVRMAGAALARGDAATADAMVSELMRGTLTPPVRAFILTVKGDAARAAGKADEARTQYDLARGIGAETDLGRYATFRLAQLNLETRDYNQAVADLAPLLDAPGDPGWRSAVLLLQGEAAYRAGDHKAAAAAFERALVEVPDRAERAARLGLAWTALRQGQTAEAGKRFAEYARLTPEDEQTTDAFVLASEMALASGDLREARAQLERVLARYPSAPRTEFARLNRAILMLRTGEATAAIPPLRDWASRAPFPPLLGRARLALAVALLTAGRMNEAQPEFLAARREGVGAPASLGLATVALAEKRLDDAVRDFTEARNEGTVAVAAAAEYGLAAVTFMQGNQAAFKTAATAALDAAPRAPSAPPLLYALTGLAAGAKEWPAAVSTAKRLVNDFPEDQRADDALERVGAAASAERAWPVVHEVYALLRQKYPRSPFVDDSRVAFAEAQIETGRAGEGRKTLEQLFAGAPNDPRATRARITLARARELTGDRAGALDAYAEAARAVPPDQWSKEALVGYARLLTGEKRYDEAKGLLQPFIKASPAPVAAEGAVALGELLEGQGDAAAAVEYYMTAAYAAPETPAGRSGLLAAGRAFAALKQPEAATTVYKKLLAQTNVPADVASAARRGLSELPR